jgi:outer membrane protein OmpA-like peptidoglycan-associated protein
LKFYTTNYLVSTFIENKLQVQILALCILLTFTSIYPQTSQTVNHAFHNTFVFGIDGGIVLPQTDYQKNKIGLSFRGTGEYFFKTNSVHLLGLKLKFGSEQVKGEDTRGTISTQDGTRILSPAFITSIFSLGLAATYSISIVDVFFPYLSGGISNLWFDPKDDQDNPAEYNAANKYNKSAIAYSLDVGFKYLISDVFSINLSANHYIPQSDYLDDVAAAFSNDAYTCVMIGFSYSLFFNNDKDKDGIESTDDLCPDEPEDLDGFEDADGCPDIDNDGDGIPDANDLCINEAEDFNGIEDEDGCAEGNEIISDQKFTIPGDNIFSPNSAMIIIEGKKYLNEVILQIQQFTNKKWRIEGHMDSVGDPKSLMTLSLERAIAVLEYFSIFEGLNRENFQVFGMGGDYPIGDNNTEEGRKQNRRIEIVPEATDVLTDSLTKPEEEFNQFILRGDDSFESNTATLKELAKILLDEIAAYIKNQPGSKWRIEGYTDNQGSASLQKKITSERAYAIYNYLIAEGLSADQFTVSGLGSSNPIANNDNQEGRSANRRILLIRED